MFMFVDEIVSILVIMQSFFTIKSSTFYFDKDFKVLIIFEVKLVELMQYNAVLKSITGIVSIPSDVRKTV